MDVYLLDSANFASMAGGTSDDMFNLSVNEFTASLDNNGSKDQASFTYYVSQASNGQFGSAGSGTSYTYQCVGSSNPVESVAPSYFPVATAGAECAAHIKDLSWADQNLLTGYDWVLYNPSAQAASQRYFVTGILNSSQTQANDPFSTTTYPDVVNAVCWAGNFVSGINPFD